MNRFLLNLLHTAFPHHLSNQHQLIECGTLHYYFDNFSSSINYKTDRYSYFNAKYRY